MALENRAVKRVLVVGGGESCDCLQDAELTDIGGETQRRARGAAAQRQVEQSRIFSEQGDGAICVTRVDRLLDFCRSIVLFDAVLEVRPSLISIFAGDDPLRVGQTGRRSGDFLNGAAPESGMFGAKALQRRVV